MKRKLTKIGGYSHTMTLPKEWVKKYCKSGYVEIEQKGDCLILKPTK